MNTQNRHTKHNKVFIAWFLLFAFSLPLLYSVPCSWAEEEDAQTGSVPYRLAPLGLERLTEMEITTVSRREEKLSTAAAAVYVITGEDIRRMGVTSIPEALRYVPGLEVAQIDNDRYAISSRGFNQEFANKLQILIDGRSLYGPLFSGVQWDERDVMIEDIDRIEIVRGPGGTLWGANAVNGVINIITKNSRDTQGALISGGIGTKEQGFSARWGGKHKDIHYRIYAKGFDRDSLSGGDHAGDWEQGQTGFRADWGDSSSDTFTLQGDIYKGRTEDFVSVPIAAPPFILTEKGDVNLRGGNVRGLWTHRFKNGSQSSFQIYYDRADRDVDFRVSQMTDTVDLDFQQEFSLEQKHKIVWGLGYRYTYNKTSKPFAIAFDPAARPLHLSSGFIQDEITLVPETLTLILGSKLEHNDYTGFEIQPNLRLTWMPDARNTVWAAVSRAVRTPSRAEVDIDARVATLPGGATVRVIGNSGFESEKLIACELGYRGEPHDAVIVDIALFYNFYDDLRTFDFRPVIVDTVPEIRGAAANDLKGETYGAEIAMQWQIADWWSIRPSYTFLKMHLRTVNRSTDPFAEGEEKQSPEHQFSLRSHMDFAAHWEFDAGIRYVDSITQLVESVEIPSYFVADFRLGWLPSRNWEFSLIGRNLLEPKHAEFRSQFAPRESAEVEQSIYGKVTWRF